LCTRELGDADSPAVLYYKVMKTTRGFVADYISTVSNYARGYKHLAPADFLWHRRLEVFLPLTAKLTVTFLGCGKLHILNAASPVAARKTRLFVLYAGTLTRTFRSSRHWTSTTISLPRTLRPSKPQFPEELPLNLHDEAHFPADRNSVTYRKGLAKIGSARAFTREER
jgi:hypothetical protein